MTIKLTRSGFEKMKAALHKLKTVKRREVVNAIEQARLKGDLTENAEYDAAKDEQFHVEKRIAELETKLSDVRIIDDEPIDPDRAFLGASVTLQEQGSSREFVYMIVSKEESDFNAGKISAESPVGQALLGKKVGAVVNVSLPRGSVSYKILKIER